MTLRVLHVASGREWRGGQRQVLLLAQGLLAHPSLETTVITGENTQLADRLMAAGVSVRPVSWGPGLDPRVAAAALREIHPGTIVHAHDNHAHALADAAARLRRVPLVVTRRLTLPIRSPARYRRAAAVIAISEAVRMRVLEAGVVATRVHVVPDAIDLGAVRTDLPWPENVPRIVNAPLIICIAALTQEKGIDVLLEAAALLRASHPSARWIVLGEGRGRAQLETRRRALSLEENVLLPGEVPQPEALLCHATVAVQPSIDEGFGSSVLDALSLGVPVVASRVGGLPEVLAHGGGVLVPPSAPQALAGAVGGLLSHPAERTRLGNEGREAVRRFAVGRLVERTLDVYRSISPVTEE